MVGRRRKRQLEGSIGTIDSEAWVLDQSSTFCAIPSPPASQYSDCTSKRQCSTNSWASFLVEEHQDLGDFEESIEPQTFEMMNPKAFCESTDLSFLRNNGLPTPGMSPQFGYLSPAAFETRLMSRAASVSTDSSRLLPPRFTTAFSAPPSRTPEPAQPGDDETVCIKLLSHLKKHSPRKGQSSYQDLDLLAKTNASVRRILRNKGVRSDYSCQLLLSGITTHMVDLCEQICSQKMEESTVPNFSDCQSQTPFKAQSEYFDKTTQPKTPSATARTQVVEATNLATEVAELLKRKPLNGFQVLGRQESHHIELDLRLQRSLAKLG